MCMGVRLAKTEANAERRTQNSEVRKEIPLRRKGGW
jgi:hypothetical protein